MPSRLALIMPVYNEADSIESTIREIHDKILIKMRNIDLFVFEDGSTDETKQILSRLKEEIPSVFIKMTSDRKGYPKAMKDAFLSINADIYQYVLSVDSDGQYEPDDFFKLWEIMQKGSVDIAMGMRISRAEPFWRKFLSWGLRQLEGLMFPISCRDVTTVMRLMNTDIAHEIVREIRYSKYNFWLEFTAIMSLKQYKVAEIPINYRARVGGSKVYGISKMPKVILSEFKALREVKRDWKLQKQQIPNYHKSQ